MLPADDLALAVVAGGRGRRLGGLVKGLIDFGGEPLVGRILRRLAPLAGKALLVVREASAFPPLGAEVVCDRHGDAGLPGALLTALEASGRPWCLAVGGDMPWVAPEVAARLLAARGGVDVVLPVHGPFSEPLFALYRAEGCREGLAAMVGEGVRRVSVLYERVRVRRVDVTAACAALPAGVDPFTNVNDPEELRAALELLARLRRSGDEGGAGTV